MFSCIVFSRTSIASEIKPFPTDSLSLNKQINRQEEFHVKVKKEYAAKLIEPLPDDDALENVEADLPNISEARLSLIQEEREQYLKGIEASLTWEQVKAFALKPFLQFC
jgi:hypothetical protein